MAEHRWDFDDVLARTDLRSLLNEVTASNGRSGRSAKWHCPSPDHADTNPSVTVATDHRGKERWRCWSNTDHRGDAIDLVRTVRGSNITDAVDWLAGRAGMIPDRPLPPALPLKPVTKRPPLTLDPKVRRYMDVTEAIMRRPVAEPAREWLARRGIGPDVIKANRIGFDPGRDRLRRDTGLPYGRGPGVVFPAFDSHGNLAYVQARYLDPDAAGRKYDNPAGVLGANPRTAFIRMSPEVMPRDGVVLVVEGIPDGLIAAQAGYTAVALLGSQAPDAVSATRIVEHTSVIGSTIVLAFDSDPAGRQGTDTLARHIHDLGVTPAVVDLPDGLDLNDWALQTPDWADELSSILEVNHGISLPDNQMEPTRLEQQEMEVVGLDR